MQTRVIAAALAAIAIAAGGWWFLRPDPQPDVSALPAPGAANAETVAAADLPEVPEINLGNSDAPVTVIEYASFTCPHCANFHLGPFQDIKANFIETGQIQYIIREVYFDPYGLWAAMVARCGGIERYHGVSELLYQTQRQWTAGDNPAAVAENLRRIGRQAGMSGDEVNACLEDREMALALTAAYQRNAEADNIRATPTFMINGRQYSNMPYSEFESVLNDLLDN
ncbi:MAG: DsbA family protein [Rhodobacteraceae bacterium]|nr:DsbA family protein [Paracoccaceae bacterium]